MLFKANKNDIRKAWNVTVENFYHELQISESSKNFGSVLESRLNDITLVFDNLQPRTIIHGDYKMSNIFIDRNSTESKIYAIDWQWCGIGHAATDLVHFIATSVHEDTIKDSLELVRFYHKILIDNGISYSWEQFWQAYQICWIEFFIYVVIAFWSTMQPNDVELYKKEEKYGLHARSYPHMKHLLTQTEIFIKDLYH
jgi:thiamine kinase-like enzyme